ncbi:MAG TPA: ATP-dependent DNA helicase [Actinomycetota bacterium]|nr:ATP-dependent DNA helicase [Actinomycetota bacterium]
MPFKPDPEQSNVLAHERGSLLVTGRAGTGKSVVLRERFARLIQEGADPERVALVVRTKEARAEARHTLVRSLERSLPSLKVLTVHGLAFHVLTERFASLGYQEPPTVLTAFDQFAKVRELLEAEDDTDWPTYAKMRRLRGFADEVRQFVLRAQEALLEPEAVTATAEHGTAIGWDEIAGFYRRYLDVLAQEGTVDYAGLVVQAAASDGSALFDHLLVDDYQEATFAEEKLLATLAPESLVVAGDIESHVFSFQGTTDVPLRRFGERFGVSGSVHLQTPHRSPSPAMEAWFSAHTSEEHAAVARELRRIHVEEGVPWGELAVVVRRHGSHVGGLLRALDDAGVPRSTAEGGLSLLSEPAVYPLALALRWSAYPDERDGVVESLLTSDLVRLSPAVARGLIRATTAAGDSPAEALLHPRQTSGMSDADFLGVQTLSAALRAASDVAHVSVLDAFGVLWRDLPYARRLVDEAEESPARWRDLDVITAFAEAVSRASARADASVAAFLEALEAGQDGPETDMGVDHGVVRVMTAHASAGFEFDTVILTGAVEGNFPSLSRPEPMFDLNLLERPLPQSERNRLRLEDERRLFTVSATRARRRVLFTASEPVGEQPKVGVRSRFVSEARVQWRPGPDGAVGEPVTLGEAVALWRRTVADTARPVPARIAALTSLLSVEEQPARWWFQRDWTGRADPLHETIRTSFSKLDKLENCALQYVLAEELGLEEEAGYYAWVGSLVHGLIEDCEKGEIPREAGALIAEAERRWRPSQFPSFAVSEAFRRTVTERMLPGWLASYGDTESLAREIHFSFEYDGATVTGYIDRVGKVQTGGSQITDYKTGKARAAKPDESLQLGIYYLAVHRAPELARFLPVKAVELAFLKERKDGGVHRAQLGLNSQAQHDYEAKMSERLSSLIARVRELMETENYRPNPGAVCRNCDFKPLCPLWPEGREVFAWEGVT